MNPDFYIKTLEELIRARKAAGISQARLAAMLGRPQSFVAKYEGSERRVDVAEFFQIAEALGEDPYRMLRRAESAESATVRPAKAPSRS